MVDEEAKTESMTVSIKASNQDFSYSAQYALTYSVEEGAWVLTNLEKSGEEYTAQALATEEEAEAVLNEKYDTYSYISQEGKENRCKFCYTASKGEGNVTIDCEVTIPFTFSPDGWNCPGRRDGIFRCLRRRFNWTADSTGTPLISGSGKAMPDYATESPAPWGSLPANFAVKIARIEAKLERLGSNACANCPQLTEVSIPETVTSAGAGAFSG